MTCQEFANQLNAWGKNQTPFFFLTDFELQQLQCWQLSELNPNELLFDFNGFGNALDNTTIANIKLKASPDSFESYQKKFEKVFHELEYGNSFLTNLTIRTPIELIGSLKEIFYSSKAKYKLWRKALPPGEGWGEAFVVFSPECFVRIEDGFIYSYPMKGTIDASVRDAKNKILTDAKELAEHVTIVDLIRNDLSIISEEVKVTRFRFVDEVKTQNRTLLQVSSEIRGKLSEDYRSRIGNIIMSLLPAGSISGAPKAKTVEIIQEAEQEAIGYFTGVAGYFDGKNLDSAVLIRFIEQTEKDYFYRSGGGITTQSNAQDEYNEAIAKIYVPVY